MEVTSNTTKHSPVDRIFPSQPTLGLMDGIFHFSICFELSIVKGAHRFYYDVKADSSVMKALLFFLALGYDLIVALLYFQTNKV